jgi:hypothetical protein
MVYELVAAGMMIKATTVVLDPIFCNRWLSPACERNDPLQKTQLRTGKRFDEHVDTLVSELVSSSSEQVDGVFQVKVVVPVEVTSDKVVDLLLGLDMQVLELVHGSELDHVQTVRQDTICKVSRIVV